MEAESHAGNRGAPANEEPRAQGVHVREQDQYMPIANVVRIMRRILPSHAKISDDAKETVQECVSEYISFVTNEANQRCREEQRKTVTAEDVLWAIGKLGFDDYVAPLSAFLARYRDGDGNRSAPRGQHVMAPQYAPPALPPPPPYYGSGYPESQNPIGMSGYYGGSGSGAASSSGDPAYYDPFAHLRPDHRY